MAPLGALLRLITKSLKPEDALVGWRVKVGSIPAGVSGVPSLPWHVPAGLGAFNFKQTVVQKSSERLSERWTWTERTVWPTCTMQRGR